jgi:hypothetical protein
MIAYETELAGGAETLPFDQRARAGRVGEINLPTSFAATAKRESSK